VDITPTEAYELFLKDPDSFKSSAPAPEECLEAFHRVSRTAESILFVTVSTKLSMMNNAALEAAAMARAELPKTTIEVMDSYQATPSEGMVALAAARAAAEGQELAEVVRAAEKVRDKVTAIILLDTIRHVYRCGRIPRVASQIGSMLNIRPILTVYDIVHFAGMARSHKQGVERVLRMMRERVGDRPVHAAVTHAYAPEEAGKLMERVASAFNCIELWLCEFSPVMGYACGTGTVGVAFYPEDQEDT